MKLSELFAQPKQTGESILLFGPPKVGKSLLAGRLAEEFNLWWFDLENGAATLMNHLEPALLEKINFFRIPDTKINPVAVRTLVKVFNGAPYEICFDHGSINCAACKQKARPISRICLNELGPNDIVVIDSLTQLWNSACAHVANAANLETFVKFGYDEWAKANQLIASILSEIQQARYNPLFISHEIMVDMQDGSSKIVPVGGTRNQSQNTAKYFSSVVYMEVSLGQFKMGSSPTYKANVVSGTRTGLILNGKDITLADLIKAKGIPTPKTPIVTEAQPVISSPAKLAALFKT